jgi:hypothetical protein
LRQEWELDWIPGQNESQRSINVFHQYQYFMQQNTEEQQKQIQKRKTRQKYGDAGLIRRRGEKMV